MLLELSVSNFKSFKSDAHLSLEACPQSELSYSLIKKNAGSTDYETVSAVMLYGPNAYGKTNILAAADTLRRIVLRGNIKNNCNDASVPDYACDDLNLIPTIHNTEATPVELSIRFIASGMLFEYELGMKLGGFMDCTYRRHICSESLRIDGCPVFIRSDGNCIEWGNVAKMSPGVQKYIRSATDTQRDIETAVAEGIADTDLVLGGPLRTVIGIALPDMIINWFKKQLKVSCGDKDLDDMSRHVIESNPKWMIQGRLTKIADALDLDSTLFYRTENKHTGPKLMSTMGGNVHIPAEYYESAGTVRLMKLFPVILNALYTGGILMVDELDRSLHPAVVGAIVALFNNDEINVHGAQLIFTTHNPIYMDETFCRRDEIKFVGIEYMANGATSIWSLSDFRTEDPKDTEAGADYMLNYMKGAYGAIKDVDFSSFVC